MPTAVVYSIVRAGSAVACAVTLPNGKCVVSWPTSTIVYDSEKAARDVHIRHMGGRGEPTQFVVDVASPAFLRGWHVCYQDRCEGIPDASGPRAPRYIPQGDRDDYEAGYWAMARLQYGEDYEPDARRWQGATAEEVHAIHAGELGGAAWTVCGIPFDPRIKRGEVRSVTCAKCRTIIEAAKKAASPEAP